MIQHSENSRREMTNAEAGVVGAVLGFGLIALLLYLAVERYHTSQRSWRRTSCCSVEPQAATPTATVEVGEKDPHVVRPQASPRMVTAIAHRSPQSRALKTTVYRSKKGTRAQVESDYWV
jgi:hypothetical protein